MNNPQLDVARRLLAEIAQTAEHATMTGALKGGERAAAQTLNGALALATGQGAVPDGMFSPLDPDDAKFGEIGVQARLLLAVLSEEPEKAKRKEGGLGALVALAPFLSSHDLGEMIRERIDDSIEIPDGLLTGLAPFLDSHDLGDLVRRRARPKAPAAPPEPPAPPQAPVPPTTLVRAEDATPATLETLASDLRRPDLTPEERQRIATRLAEMAYEQAVRGG